MSYKEINVGLNDEMIERFAEDYLEKQPVNTNLRFCKALNPEEIKRRYIKRIKNLNRELERMGKKQGKIVWLSKMPISYFLTHGNWGDSQFTYNSAIHPYPFTLKPGYELVQT